MNSLNVSKLWKSDVHVVRAKYGLEYSDFVGIICRYVRRIWPRILCYFVAVSFVFVDNKMVGYVVDARDNEFTVTYQFPNSVIDY